MLLIHHIWAPMYVHIIHIVHFLYALHEHLHFATIFEFHIILTQMAVNDIS